jgi:hypothetical protein
MALIQEQQTDDGTGGISDNGINDIPAIPGEI